MSKAHRTTALLLVLAALLSAAAPAGAQRKKDKDENVRALHGQVMDQDDNPLEKAVVHLKNTRTLQVRTFITPKDGFFHFYGLSTNVDYEVRAEHNGVSSSTRTLSTFDGRKDATLNLKIEPKK
jgi:hypothetical protein